MCLNRAVHHILCHLRRNDLDGCDQIPRFLIAITVHRISGLQRKKAGLFDLAP